MLNAYIFSLQKLQIKPQIINNPSMDKIGQLQKQDIRVTILKLFFFSTSKAHFANIGSYFLNIFAKRHAWEIVRLYIMLVSEEIQTTVLHKLFVKSQYIWKLVLIVKKVIQFHLSSYWFSNAPKWKSYATLQPYMKPWGMITCLDHRSRCNSLGSKIFYTDDRKKLKWGRKSTQNSYSTYYCSWCF